MSDQPWKGRRSKDVVFMAHVVQKDGWEFGSRLVREGDRLRHEVANRIDGAWVERVTDTFVPDLESFLEKNIMLTVEHTRAVDIDVDPTYESLVTHRIPIRLGEEVDPDGWPDGVADAWVEEDAELPEEVPAIRLWARINGSRVLVLPNGGAAGGWRALYHVWEGRFFGLRVLAETSWFSESGGAPISWDGWGRLSELHPGMLLCEFGGDVRQEQSMIPAVGPIGVGAAVADFIVTDDQQFAAALNLEPFDPDGTLSPSDREEWVGLLSGPDVDVTLHLDDEEQDACREALRGNRAYAFVAEALRNPQGSEGSSLRERLEVVEETGVIGGVMGYELG